MTGPGGRRRSPGPATRFPARLYREGTEPDPRFTLANERTFLAWIRTGVAFMAGGVALHAFVPGLQPGLHLTASLLLLLAGLLIPVQAWCGWYRTERAIRSGRPLPPPVSALPVAVGAGLAALAVAAAMVVR